MAIATVFGGPFGGDKQLGKNAAGSFVSLARQVLPGVNRHAAPSWFDNMNRSEGNGPGRRLLEIV